MDILFVKVSGYKVIQLLRSIFIGQNRCPWKWDLLYSYCQRSSIHLRSSRKRSSPNLISEAVHSIRRYFLGSVVSADDDRSQWVTGRTNEPTTERRKEGRNERAREGRSLIDEKGSFGIHPRDVCATASGANLIMKEAPSPLRLDSSPSQLPSLQ